MEEKQKFYYLDKNNYVFFIRSIKKILPIAKMIKQYDLDFVYAMCNRFKRLGTLIYFSESEINQFNKILSHYYISSKKLAGIEELKEERKENAE